ncbi:hypothetical protein GCM10022297_00190 [Lactobacillus hamsteri]|uniref:DUF2922 domain-containing protein n=1 Tax=Lactobacillus hamsteri DSM 5661 = JCM 6256 TaxID=1423754 RepID=A0A0R1YI80_9LACO|nr:DUF2922 domain-containing protein [Lactobacillus hamsteri]KRM39382.1 hypothetical protein FC39_GL001125 [Lactobacillus hamsteri DSM 5661 = JCM 6256]
MKNQSKEIKTLRLTFKNGEGKKNSLSVQGPAELKKEEVIQCMQDIASANIFAKEGIDLYKEPQSATVVTRNSYIVFDAEKPTDSKQD